LLNTTAGRNVAIGSFALSDQSYINGGVSWNSDNVAVGYRALGNNQPTSTINGIFNTAIGTFAMLNNSTGSKNTATGTNTLYSNLGGNNNTADGMEALFANTSGGDNTAQGAFALHSNLSGSSNTATGYYSLYSNTTGHSNTANGFFSLGNNSAGYRNTAIGIQSLNGNTVGWENTASGYQALFHNGDGNYNTASGSAALYENDFGDYNTASGFQAAYQNYGGNYNTAIGVNALYWNVAGNENTALGYSAGSGAAGFNFTQCTFLGDISTLTFPRTNVTMLGYGITNGQCTADHQVLLGNTAIGQIRAQVTGITAYSDARFKTNVKENVAGLDFILKLKPVTYNVRPIELHRIWGTPDSIVNKIDHSQIEKQIQIGFLAQDVEKAAQESGFNFPGIDVPGNDKEVYSLRYVDFIMPIVKSVQELAEKNTQLKSANVQLVSEVEDLRAEILKINAENQLMSQRLENIEALIKANQPNHN